MSCVVRIRKPWAKAKLYYEANREALIYKAKVWSQKNPDKIRKKNANYRLRHAAEIRIAAKIWYSNNKEKEKERQRIWAIKNPEKVNARVRRYAQNHPDRIKETRRKSYLKHRVANLKRTKLWAHNNRQKLKIIERAWKQKNRERFLERKRQWYSKNKGRIEATRSAKYKSDVGFRMKRVLSSRLSIAVKRQGHYRMKGDTAKYIGCSYAELQSYLESLFVVGMSWKNHGKHGWHIDHIIPCSSFNLRDEDQLRKCFHYSNLQPLWAKENMQKSSSLKWKRN